MAAMLWCTSCVDLDITTPKGAKGPNGPDGMSDYDLWKTEVEAGRIAWNKEHTTLTDFFKFLKGNDGPMASTVPMAKTGRVPTSCGKRWWNRAMWTTPTNPARNGQPQKHLSQTSGDSSPEQAVRQDLCHT